MPTDRSQFIVPAGLELEHGPEGLVIRFPGDVVLDAPLGPRVRLIESRGGDISFGADVEVDEIIALSGKVTARAGLRVRSLSAADVHIRGALRADVVVGRSVRLDGGATCGQITALAGDLVTQGAVRVSGDVVVEHGDLVCHSDLTAANVRASGRVVLRGPAELGRVEAGRELLAQAALVADQLLSGAAIECLDNVDARIARAETIRLSGPRSEIKQVQARALIAVGAGKVMGDVFIAPVVDLAARSTGRITVVESHNELGASAVSGKLRLSELGALISDVDGFLRDRGMTRLDEAPAPWPERSAPRAAAPPSPAARPAADGPGPAAGRGSAPRSAAEGEPAPAAPRPAAVVEPAAPRPAPSAALPAPAAAPAPVAPAPSAPASAVSSAPAVPELAALAAPAVAALSAAVAEDRMVAEDLAEAEGAEPVDGATAPAAPVAAAPVAAAPVAAAPVAAAPVAADPVVAPVVDPVPAVGAPDLGAVGGAPSAGAGPVTGAEEPASAGLSGRPSRRPVLPPPPPVAPPRVETLEEILAAYPGLLGPGPAAPPAPRPAAPPVGVDPLDELEWWSEELNSGPVEPPAELRPDELRAARDGAAPLAADLEGDLLATSALEEDLRAAGLIGPGVPAAPPAPVAGRAVAATPVAPEAPEPPPVAAPAPVAPPAVDWTEPSAAAGAAPDGAAWLDAAALDESLLDETADLDESALDADLLMDAGEPAADEPPPAAPAPGLSQPLEPHRSSAPPAEAAALATPPPPLAAALDDLNLDDLNLDELLLDGRIAEEGPPGAAPDAWSEEQEPLPAAVAEPSAEPVDALAVGGGRDLPALGAPGPAGLEPLTEEAVTAQAGGVLGDELLTGELKLPDLGDLSSMDEETLLRKLIEQPIGAFGAMAAIVGGVTPATQAPPKPIEPSTEELRIGEELVAAAFDFEPSPDEGEADSGVAPPAPPVSPALRPARPHVPLTDAPSLSFVSPRALVGAEPGPEEALFDVPLGSFDLDDEVAAQLASQSEVESGPLALGAAGGPDALLDPAARGAIFDMGGPDDGLEDPLDPPTEGSRSRVDPSATVEEVPVRPPGGPLPVGMGQLMLIEEPSGALRAAAPSPAPAAAAPPDAPPDPSPADRAPPSAPETPAVTRRPPPVGLSPVSAPTLPVPPPRPATVEEDDDELERSAPINPVRAPAPPPVAAPRAPAAAPPLTPPTPAPQAPPPVAPNRDVSADPVLSLMFETLGRIRGAYAGGPTPPPVDDIAALLRTQDYGRIRAEFPPLVTALMDHHRANGGTVNPKVSHQLRIIDTLVRNL